MKTSSILRHQNEPKKAGNHRESEVVDRISMIFQERRTTLCEDLESARKELHWCSIPFQKVRTVSCSIDKIAESQFVLQESDDQVEQLGLIFDCLGVD
jgi:hypothetical protein